MDQVIEVARHPSSEDVHHEVHMFLHHLHLHDYVRGSRICGEWSAGILLLLSAWGVAAFRPLLIPSFSASSFLVFLLGVKRCVFFGATVPLGYDSTW